MFESIAQYYEVRPNGRRHFELFKDRLIVRSKTARVESEITLMLANLRPEPNRLRVRPKEFGFGLMLLVISAGLAIVAVLTAGTAVNPRLWNAVWFSVAGGAFFVSLVIFAKTARKIEFIQFVSHHENVLLDVARSGPQRHEFDSFVETLIAQIRASQKYEPSTM
jgi:hypothetical protein